MGLIFKLGYGYYAYIINYYLGKVHIYTYWVLVYNKE